MKEGRIASISEGGCASPLVKNNQIERRIGLEGFDGEGVTQLRLL